MKKDFDLSLCESRGWPLVRRLTGGRAVFHDHELTYSLFLPVACCPAGPGVLESYRYISQGLLLALRHLGVRAELVSPKRNRKPRGRPGVGSPDCFASPSWYEVAVEGRKIVGSAQRRLPEGILQQGSILISTRRFGEFYGVLRKKGTPAGEGEPGEGMTSLEEALGQTPSLEQVRSAVLQGFSEAHRISFRETEVTDNDKREAEALVRLRYGTSEWNLCRKPAVFKGKSS
jgi:lipoate-protein ligase A